MITVGKASQLAAAISAKQAQVDAYEADLLAAGMGFQGNVFQVDADAQSHMQAVMIGYLMGQTSPSGGVWRDIANVNVTMDDPTVKALILAAQSYVRAAMFNAWAHKDAIGKLTTLAAVASYDFTTGWPANS